MTTPRKARVELIVEQKHEIICYKEANPKITQIQLKAILDKKFDTIIRKTTICDIIQLKSKIMKLDEVKNDYNKRMRSAI
jgi:hypothetical protein